MQDFRIEQDSLGNKQIPNSVYYGIQTVRGVENSSISGQSMDEFPDFVHAIAIIKKAAAIANYKSEAFSKELCQAICQACDEILENKLRGNFPLDIIQGGGGTSANMNLNEVIANRANEIITGHKGYEVVHPNTHVNMGQSTNDVIPTAMKIACHTYFGRLAMELEKLGKVFRKKETEFQDVVKMGRTCIQDALPITLGQEFSGYASLIERRFINIKNLQEKCVKLPLGGTAVGTKVGIKPNYLDNVYTELSNILGYQVYPDDNFFDGLQNADLYVDLSGGLKSLAISLSKIAADLRLLSSGPNLGLKEIILPAVQPGSSIMPGKYNPVIPELVIQTCQVVCGNDFAISMAAEAGELDLNVWEPVIIKSIAESAILLTGSIKHFAEKCINDIVANKEYCYECSSNSLALSTVIATLIDYPTGSMVAQKAMREKKTVKQVCLEEKILTKEQADILLDPILLTDGDLFAQKIEEYKNKI